jgi:hypothetical protein
MLSNVNTVEVPSAATRATVIAPVDSSLVARNVIPEPKSTSPRLFPCTLTEFPGRFLALAAEKPAALAARSWLLSFFRGLSRNELTALTAAAFFARADRSAPAPCLHFSEPGRYGETAGVYWGALTARCSRRNP